MNTPVSLPGIKSIAYINSNALPPELMMQAIAGLDIPTPTSSVKIPFHGEATCECTSIQTPSISESVELTFSSLADLPSDKHLAFLVTDANSIPYLVGTCEHYPSIERQRAFGSPDADSNLYTYTIKLSAPRALIRCTLA